MLLNAGKMPANEAILEVHHEGGPEGAINAFCDLIESLSPDTSALWKRCKERTFRSDIGPDTLARVAKVGAMLAVSIYGYRSKGGQ